MKYLATTFIGVFTLSVLSANCLAGEQPNDVRRQVVRFAELDLTRPAGAEELYRRIQRAAREVCQIDGWRGYASMECINSAIARAVAAVNTPLLTAHHQAATHAPILQPQHARLNR
jgi:UrcA family protein